MIQRETEWQEREEVPLVLSERVHSSSRPNLRVYAHESRFYLIAKRTMDIVLSSVALAVLFPFLVVVSVIIYLDDPTGGPVFVQDRVGKNGKIFKFLNARAMLDAGYVARRIGRILRYLLCETHESIMDTSFQTSNCGTRLARAGTCESRSASMDIERIRGSRSLVSMSVSVQIERVMRWRSIYHATIRCTMLHNKGLFPSGAKLKYSTWVT